MCGKSSIPFTYFVIFSVGSPLMLQAIRILEKLQKDFNSQWPSECNVNKNEIVSLDSKTVTKQLKYFERTRGGFEKEFYL